MRTVIEIGAVAAIGALSSTVVFAAGEEVDGYPSWEERVYLEWTNRARCDPQIEMDACGESCPEATCYSPEPPLRHDIALARPSRYHCQEMEVRGFFSHDSNCTLVDDIGQLWPEQCDGSAACACEGGVAQCSGACTSPQARVGLFGAGYGGEVSVGVGDPDWGFYLWLHETSMGDACAFAGGNGHRWLLLTSQGRVGFGNYGSYGNGDFGFGGGAADEHPIPSGSHYPRAGSTVEAWANWYGDAGPSLTTVNLDGTCEPMSLERGTDQNGAWAATLEGLDPQTCHRYYFVFKDAAGNEVTYPTEGSLGIGPSQSCPDWSEDRPPLGEGCDCQPSCDGVTCGDNGCGGSCGTCGDGESCDAGACAPVDPTDGGNDGPGPTSGEDGTDDGADDGTGGNKPADGGDGPLGDDDDDTDGAGPGRDTDDALPPSFGADGQATGCRVGAPTLAPSLLFLLALPALRRRRRTR